MRRNRRHLLKMDSNFVETENGTDMENDIEAEPKTRHSMSETEPEEEEIWENATELREASSYTTWSRRRVIKPSRYGEQGTVKILIVKGEC